ncbi:Alpha/Beta hydrolase protein [Geopyxis carbonaria]|nr:Alpha/Beta hydrolase protein [Geopyxis carbonaria]
MASLQSLEAGCSITESRLTLPDGLSAYTKTYTPFTPPIAHTVFIHGFSDHLGTYTYLPLLLARAGILQHSIDLRGFGHTSPAPSEWGNTGPTATLLSDLDTHIASRLALHPDLPLFLVGHSMGGALALTYAASGTHRAKLAGVAVWSPLLALAPATRPWALTEAAGRAAARLFPRRQMVSKLDPALLCRDPEVGAEFVADKMCHDTGTLEGLASMLERGRALRSSGGGRGVPAGCAVYVAHGTGDGVTDWRVSKAFVEGLGQVTDREFRAYDGWFHKLHAEPGEDKVRFGDELAEWITSRAKRAGSAGSAGSKL